MGNAAELTVRINADVSGADRGFNQVERRVSNFGSMLKGAVGTGVGVLGAQLVGTIGSNIASWGSGILMASANAETARQTLEVATGDAAKAGSIFDALQTKAKQTPYEFPELIQSATMLESFGLDSLKWMDTIGNTASGTGKSVGQVTEAVMDAQMGEFERLKELGIKATYEGDKVKFTYMKNGKEMTEFADKNSQEMIANTVKGIWDSKYEGAMAKQSQTFMGQWSTLKDNWNMTIQSMTGGIFEFAKDGLKHANMFFDRFNVGLERGMSPFQAAVRALKFSLQDVFGKETGNQIFGVINGIGTGLGMAAGYAKDFIASVASSRAVAAFMKMGKAVFDIGKAFKTGGLTAGFKEIFGSGGRRLISGFGDFVGARFKTIGDFIGDLKTGIEPLDRLLTQTSRAFNDMGRMVQDVFQGDFSGAMEVGERLLGRMGDIGRAAFDSIKAGMDAIDWGSVASGIGDFASGAWSAIQTGISLAWDEITALDWDSYITAIGDLGALVAEKIKELPWGAMINKVTDLGRWIVTKVGDLPWATIVQRVTDLGRWIVTKVGDLPWGSIISRVADLGRWIATKVTSLPWGTVIDKVTDLGKWVAGKVGSIPWGDLITGTVEVGSWLWDKIKGYFPTASVIGSTIAVFGDWLWGKIKSFFPSSSVITDAIGNLGDWLWGKINTYFPAAAVMTDAIGNFGDWVWGKIGGYFPSGAVITGSIGDFGEWLWGKIKDKFPGGSVLGGGGPAGTSTNPDAPVTRQGMFYDPAYQNPITGQQYVEHSPGPGYALEQGPPVTYEPARLGIAYEVDADITKIEGKLKGLFGGGTEGGAGGTWAAPPLNVAAFETSASTLPITVGQAMSDALSAASTYGGAISNSIGQSMSESLSAASTYGNAITNAVGQAMSNALSVTSVYMGAIPGIVASHLSAAASSAYSSGVAIGQGLAQGISSQVGAVAAAARQLAFAAESGTALQLDIASPSKVFERMGQQVGDGFVRGIEERYGAANRAGQGLANASIPTAGFSGRRGVGDGPTIIIVTPDSENFSEIARMARRGGDFAEQLPQMLRQGVSG